METKIYKGHSKTEAAICLECNKNFAASKSELQRGHAKFCSLSCSTTHSNKQRSAKEPNCICSSCDKAIYRKKSQLEKNTIFFCNRHCQTEWKRTHKWTISNKRPSSWKKLALLIKEERGNKCEKCGWAEANCDVAHIIPRSKGGKDTRENALVLCPNHHRILDSQ